MAKCPICATPQARWQDYNGRKGVRCPKCKGLERHRHFFNTMKDAGLLGTPASEPALLLSVSADDPYINLLRRYYFVQIITVDPRGDARTGDVCNLPYADNSIDVAISNHVMEHVKDDNLGTRELCRVLKPGGVYVSCVPCTGDKTEQFKKLMPPHGHWREYGIADYRQQLVDCGFREATLGRGQVFVARK